MWNRLCKGETLLLQIVYGAAGNMERPHALKCCLLREKLNYDTGVATGN